MWVQLELINLLSIESQQIDLNSIVNSNPKMKISKNISLSILGLELNIYELIIGI